MQAETIFRIYSMTKPITSAAMMMLCEEGRFQLNDPVSKYIPEFKDRKVLVEVSETEVELVDAEREMTIRDLLNRFLDFLGDDVQTAALSVHLGDALQTELLLRNESLTRRETAQLEQFVQRPIPGYDGSLLEGHDHFNRPSAGAGRHLVARRPPRAQPGVGSPADLG